MEPKIKLEDSCSTIGNRLWKKIEYNEDIDNVRMGRMLRNANADVSITVQTKVGLRVYSV